METQELIRKRQAIKGEGERQNGTFVYHYHKRPACTFLLAESELRLGRIAIGDLPEPFLSYDFFDIFANQRLCRIMVYHIEK